MRTLACISWIEKNWRTCYLLSCFTSRWSIYLLHLWNVCDSSMAWRRPTSSSDATWAKRPGDAIQERHRPQSAKSIHNHHQPSTSWWFQPLLKILISQIGSFPQVGVKIKNIWNHQLDPPYLNHLDKMMWWHIPRRRFQLHLSMEAPYALGKHSFVNVMNCEESFQAVPASASHLASALSLSFKSCNVRNTFEGLLRKMKPYPLCINQSQNCQDHHPMNW